MTMKNALPLLTEALQSVDWNSHVSDFLSNTTDATLVAEKNYKLAIWFTQLTKLDKGNPALCFINASQAQSHIVCSLFALALYQPAIVAMRAMLESSLYYTYFRTHFEELRTLQKDESWFLDKSSILDYHKRHSINFSVKEKPLGLVSNLQVWYKKASLITHTQIPGHFVYHTRLDGIKISSKDLNLSSLMFEECVEIINKLFLCTVAPDHWSGVEKSCKEIILKGIDIKTRTILELSIM